MIKKVKMIVVPILREKTTRFWKKSNPVQGMFNVVKDTANRDLNDLMDKDLIEKRGIGPKIHYVSSAVRYRPIRR